MRTLLMVVAKISEQRTDRRSAAGSVSAVEFSIDQFSCAHRGGRNPLPEGYAIDVRDDCLVSAALLECRKSKRVGLKGSLVLGRHPSRYHIPGA